MFAKLRHRYWILLVLALSFSILASTLAPATASASTSSDVIVYVGQLGADTYTQTLNGILYTEGQIGFMADNILWTEEQIGFMADRIVYVTEMSQDNSVEIIYQVTSLWSLGTQDGGYLYQVALMPVAALPAGW
jgi:hypothetical protein